MDIVDERDGLIQQREKLAKAFYTGVWDCGRKIEHIGFLELCLNTLEEMLAWNEPITWDEYRALVWQREAEGGQNI